MKLIPNGQSIFAASNRKVGSENNTLLTVFQVQLHLKICSKYVIVIIIGPLSMSAIKNYLSLELLPKPRSSTASDGHYYLNLSAVAYMQQETSVIIFILLKFVVS